MYHIDGNFSAKNYNSGFNKSIADTTDNRGWKKNLLEIEQVKNFKVGGQDLGEVFIVKSEFSPTAYAIQGKWVPIYEYYAKNENEEMVRIGSGKINEKTDKMETTLSTNGQDISDDIKYENEQLKKAKEDGIVIQFDSSQYTGISTKTSRKDIEQVITTKAIQAYLGKEKQIADITQVRDMTNVTYDRKGNSQIKNTYMVACVENGIETYEIVSIDENGKCEQYFGMSKDMFAKKEMYFPTGITTGYDKKTSLNMLDKKQALESFKSSEGLQYQAYRDENGNLRVAQIIEHTSGEVTYAEELDTYNVMHGDIEKIKLQSNEKNEKTLLLESKQKEKNTALQLESKENDSLSI